MMGIISLVLCVFIVVKLKLIGFAIVMLIGFAEFNMKKNIEDVSNRLETFRFEHFPENHEKEAWMETDFGDDDK